MDRDDTNHPPTPNENGHPKVAVFTAAPLSSLLAPRGDDDYFALALAMICSAIAFGTGS